MCFLRFPAILGALLLLLAAGAGAQDGLATFKSGSVTINGASGSHKFTVELAADERQREQGLMFRQKMAADAGMLFLYQAPEQIAMWMKNTYIPLDILFMRADGTIANIRERAVPQSTETLPSDGPVSAALELNGGTVARLGIKPGDKVVGQGLGE